MQAYNLLHAGAFKLRGLAMVPPLCFVGLWFQSEWENEAVVWPIGLAVFGAGMVLRIWAQQHLRYRLPGERTLATTGPYAWMRNPVYAGNLALFAGLCVLCELPGAIPLVCGWAGLVYHWAIQFEEVRLLKRYGETYAAYRQAVRRWFPVWRGLSEQARATIGEWIDALRVEWHCLFLLLIPATKQCLARFVLTRL